MRQCEAIEQKEPGKSHEKLKRRDDEMEKKKEEWTKIKYKRKCKNVNENLKELKYNVFDFVESL